MEHDHPFSFEPPIIGAPARLLIAYLRWSPLSKGKRLIAAGLRLLLPPPPAQFLTDLPGGGRIALFFREAIGMDILVRGQFERSEIEAIASLARPDTVAVDVGANAGVFTIPLARAVGVTGRILAFEPHPANLDRLTRNLLLNRIQNVEVFSFALGGEEGKCVLEEAVDPGYHSTARVMGARSGRFIRVARRPLDAIWRSLGAPDVSAIKVDVEGDELEVLEGAGSLFSACRPALLIEAHGRERRARIDSLLRPLGYRGEQPGGFMPWNHLFVAPKAGLNLATSRGVSRPM